MGPVYLSRSRTNFIGLCSLVFFASSAFAGTILIGSPGASSTVSTAVPISASVTESRPFHVEIWDNGGKLGNFLSGQVNTTTVMPQGRHVMTVLAVSDGGRILDRSSVIYNVAALVAPVSAPPVVAPLISSPPSLTITSPLAGSSMFSAVPVSASAKQCTDCHLEIWDNGRKLGNFFSTTVNTTTVLPAGRHITTVLAVGNDGRVFERSSVIYNVVTQASSTPVPPSPVRTTSLPPTIVPPIPVLPIPVPPVPISPVGSMPPTAQVGGGVTISSPTPGSTSVSAVRISASFNYSKSFHLEIIDNSLKLGEVQASSVDGVYVLPNGSHVLTVSAIDNTSGSIITTSSVNYAVAENCNPASAQCDMDQLGVDNSQSVCSPYFEVSWLANPCGEGIQGDNGTFPLSTLLEGKTEAGAISDLGNLTLNGHSLHVSETQGNTWSNVLFRSQTPVTLPRASIDSHWTMDEYVYLPDPTAHQAFEMDAQYSAGGIWTKFYTECAFNMHLGTGYWGVFDSETGGWIFLDGGTHNGQVTPVVPCNRAQFSQPWAGSSDPSFTGWHHIAWSFLRNPDGTVTFQNLTFDATTTAINFTPISKTGGSVGGNGNFGALIQLDGMYNGAGQHPVVDAYISELTLTHTP
jgi:hypothetical protein